ncbi:hypothetical protein CAEBREN_08199 [Caenorhabditis brenneri]|uniref:ShKT domain-containing protein n=1 Tax=Caenorhabditis brenneri TaxID=135651 RepID=G0MU05_CAEBE|nr:hypothetical protein CAEBREN_08199 [Caenorhabditis brenneri]
MIAFILFAFLTPQSMGDITGDFNCTTFNGVSVIPRINCASITNTQCNSPAWRTIIASDCPSSCGFCEEGGCVDAVTNCGTDLSICRNIGMQDFVNTFCQKTCARCPSSSTTSTTRRFVTSTTRGRVLTTTPCTSFIPDSSTSCATWADNGFCTNDFFTIEQRRARCATTCRIC